MLDREPGSALWRQIADSVRDDIVTGRLRAGDRLDTELALSLRFGVNRHTVRQAIGSLALDGYLKVERGKGTFVLGRAIDYPLGARTRYTEIMLAQGYEPRRDVLDTSTIAAGGDEAAVLKVRKGTKLVLVETRSYADAETLAFSRHLFPATRLAGIADHVRETGSISRALEVLGHGDYTRAWTRVSAELPDQHTAAMIGCPQSRPVLHTESLSVSADGTPIELGHAYFAGDICRLTVAGSQTP